MVKVNSSISNEILTATVTASNLTVPVQYACYLYCDNEVIVKCGYQKENVFTFPLESAGTYHVRGFIRWPKTGGSGYERQAANGKPLTFSTGLLDEYQAFLRDGKARPLPPLPFIKTAYPKQDMLIAVSRAHAQVSGAVGCAMEELGRALQLNITTIEPTVTVLSALEPLRQDGRYAFFSGTGRIATRLIMGMGDVDSAATADALSGQTGIFELIRVDAKEMTVETDCMGVGKLYYYQDGEVALISSRVHLIVLAMEKLSITRRPNMDRIYASLSHHILSPAEFLPGAECGGAGCPTGGQQAAHPPGRRPGGSGKDWAAPTAVPAHPL